jgi:hypothetical protein
MGDLTDFRRDVLDPEEGKPDDAGDSDPQQEDDDDGKSG